MRVESEVRTPDEHPQGANVADVVALSPPGGGGQLSNPALKERDWRERITYSNKRLYRSKKL